MTGFDSAWLAAHEAKMQALKTGTEVVLSNAFGDTIEFRLLKPFKLLNETIRMHWAVRKDYQRDLSRQIANIADLTRVALPMQKAEVTIVRYSTMVPDQDGLVPKQLIDCLLVRSDRHPDGLGIIVDDSPDHMLLSVRHEKVSKRAAQRTEVSIKRVG